ncbi:MAG TPA: pit accessory protein [Verrucomicrobiales bacterium]|nr:pit accessory protein [Verrucomicrobiales bacterium]
MISLQKLLGKDDRFFALLEASAEEARHSVQALNRLLQTPGKTPSLDEFHSSKEADRRITAQINEALVNTFVSQLEREDIEVLSAALYKVPKTVEKIAERFIISSGVIKDIDFSKHAALMDKATQHVVSLVKLLRRLGAGCLEEAKRLNGELQRVEGEADDLILEILKDLYSGKYEATKVIAMKDLYELLEKVVDRCRDAGNVVTHIVLKNS